MDLSSAYTVTGETLWVQLSDDHSGGCIIGDAIRIVQVSSPPTPAPAPIPTSLQLASPLLQVFDGSTELLDTLSTVQFGTVGVADTAIRSLVIQNPPSATANLTLGDIHLDGPGFLVVSGTSDVSLAPGESMLLVIRMTTATAGPRSANLTIQTQEGERLLSLVLAGQVQTAVSGGAEPAAPAAPANNNQGAEGEADVALLGLLEADSPLSLAEAEGPERLLPDVDRKPRDRTAEHIDEAVLSLSNWLDPLDVDLALLGV